MDLFERDLMALTTCPDSGSALSEMEPWLYGSVASLYPILCRTPVLQQDIDSFFESEVWSVARAMAEWGEPDDVRHWFFSRYGRLREPDAINLDTAVPGEGYPNFWSCVAIPDFVTELVRLPPEDLVMELLPKQRFGLGLDLGCGQGGMLQHMARVCDRVVGVETSFYLAATANRLLPASEIPISFFVPELGDQLRTLTKQPINHARAICADIHALPFNRPLFDWVHCGHVLDLVEDPEMVVAQIIEVLKPGGLLSILTPWDLPDQQHFQDMEAMLASAFEQVAQRDGFPWLRFHHKRRFVLHEDWLWMGYLKD